MSDQTLARTAPLAVHANFAWSFAGKAAYAASRAVILILVAKLGTAAMVGQYAFAFAVTTPIFMLADLDLRSVLATDTRGGPEFGHYVGLRLSTTALAMAAVCVLALLQADPQTFLITLLVGAAKAFETMSDMYYGLLQKHERMNRLGISLMLKGLFSVLAMGLLLWATRSLAASAAGLAAAWLLLLMLYDIPACRAFSPVRPRLSPRHLWGLARLSLPLGMVFLFASLNRNMSAYFIQAFQGSEQLGYFSAMLYLLATGSLVASALGQSVNARLARLFARGDTRAFLAAYGKAAAFTAAAGSGILLVCALFGRQILTLLYTPEYAAYYGVFLVVMLGAGVSYVCDLTNYAITATRRFRIQPVIHGCALILAVGLNQLLVPSGGLMGAAWCVVAVCCLQLAGNLAALAGTVRRKRRDELTRAEEAESGIRVEVISQIDSLTPELLAGWKEILWLNGCGTPYAHPDWLAQWWKAFGRGKEAMILTVYDSEGLAGVLPLVRRRRLGLSTVTLMGSPQAAYSSLALRPGGEPEVFYAALRHLSREGGAMVCRLSGLTEGGAASRALNRQLAARGFRSFTSRTPGYAVRINGRCYQELHRARFSPSTAKSERKAENKLRLLGDLSVRELTAGDMDAAFALHAKRWSRKIDTSGICGEYSRKFFKSLLDGDSKEYAVKALGLFLDGRLIAFFYGFEQSRRLYGHMLAHDDLFAVCSPGAMIVREAVRKCISDGVDVLDLGPGYEEYKLAWADEEHWSLNFTFSPGGAAALPFFLALRAVEASKCKLKQNRKIVLFKRNTLGRWRHALSPARMVRMIGRELAAARRTGLRGWFRSGRTLRYAYKLNSPELAGSLPKTAHPVGYRDAEELGLLLRQPEERVIRRFCRGERCYAMKSGGMIIVCAWASEEGGQTVFHDFRLHRRLCADKDILCVLLAMVEAIPKGRSSGIVLELGARDGAVKRAATIAGKLLEIGPTIDQAAKAQENGGLAHADADR